ncbi:hypothetical protein F4678DRAFT_414969 [Xylaria arbuscula]|nr:hypothetical protein F4678DRAFT_414969 [Xylaria arbuscula]
MHIPIGNSIPHKQIRDVLTLSQIKRDTDGSSNDSSAAVLGTIIIPIIFGSVFIPLFIVMYRSWKWERANLLKNQQAQASEEGNGGIVQKAELSGDSSVVISEMDSQREDQELPDGKGGLSHEILGAIAMPQELPGDLHEMPANECKTKSEEAKQDINPTSRLNNTEGEGHVT